MVLNSWADYFNGGILNCYQDGRDASMCLGIMVKNNDNSAE